MGPGRHERRPPGGGVVDVRLRTVLAVVLVLMSCAGCASSPSDEELVGCLAAAQRGRLVEAADTLSRIEGTGPVQVNARDIDAVMRFRTERADLFEDACTAVAPASAGGSGSSDGLSALLGFVGVVVGGLLAMMTSLYTLRQTRRGNAEDALDDGLERLRGLVDELAEATSEQTAPDRTARHDRVDGVRRAARRFRASARPKAWSTVGDALDALSATVQLPIPDGEAARARRRSELDQQCTTVETACAELRRSRRGRAFRVRGR